MPFWPWYMLVCAVLIYLGRRDKAWRGPAVILAGLVGMRGVMWGLPSELQELTACALWLFVGSVLAKLRLPLAAILCATSGAAYTALRGMGFGIEYLGVVPIVTDLLMLAGLLAASTGGWHGILFATRLGSIYRRRRFGDGGVVVDS